MSDETTRTSIRRLPAEGDPPTDPPADPSPSAVQWTDWPLRRNPGLAIGTVGGLLVVFLLVTFATGKAYLGAMAVTAGLLVAWRIYIPMAYRVDGNGLMLRVGRRRWKLGWAAIERIDVRPDGFLVLPAQRRERSGPWRQVYIPAGPRRQAVLDCIQHWAPHLVAPLAKDCSA